MEGSRKNPKDVFGHKVRNLEMIPKLEAALSDEIEKLLMTWCELRGASCKLLRRQLWDRGDDVRQSANVSFSNGFWPRMYSHDTNKVPYLRARLIGTANRSREI